MTTANNLVSYYASNLAEFDKTIAWRNFIAQSGLIDCELDRMLLAYSRARAKNMASYSNLWVANTDHTGSTEEE
jgi:hypothetical protein